MKNISFFLVVLSLVTIVVFVQSDGDRLSKSLIRDSQPTVGDTLPQFMLKDMDGNEIDYFSLQGPGISAIFILPKPCLTCNPNYYFLDKLSRRYGKYFSPTWIFCPRKKSTFDEKYYFQNTYDVYIPVNIEAFTRLFKIKFKMPQITLLKGAKVIYSKSGNLVADDYLTIRKIIKGDPT